MDNGNVAENQCKHENTENIPEFFEPGYVHRVIDMLPSYIPEELKLYLKQENPDIEVITDPSILKLKNIDNVDYPDDNWTEGKKKDFLYLSVGAQDLAETLITHLALASLRENEIDIQDSFGHQEDLEILQTYINEETMQILEIAFLSGDFKYTNECLNKLNQPNLYEIVYSYGKYITDINNDNGYEQKDRLYYIQNIFGCLIKGKDSIRMYISKDLESLEEKYKQEIYIHEILHYLSIDEEEDIPRVGLLFENLNGFEKLKEIY